MGLAIALLITGFALDDTALQLVGFAFLFTSGSLLLAGSVEYKSGELSEDIYIYGDNFTSELPHWIHSTEPNPNLVKDIFLFHINQTTVYNYNNFDDNTSHFLGVFLMIVSILGSAVIFTRLKQEKDSGGFD